MYNVAEKREKNRDLQIPSAMAWKLVDDSIKSVMPEPAVKSKSDDAKPTDKLSLNLNIYVFNGTGIESKSKKAELNYSNSPM